MAARKVTNSSHNDVWCIFHHISKPSHFCSRRVYRIKNRIDISTPVRFRAYTYAELHQLFADVRRYIDAKIKAGL